MKIELHKIKVRDIVDGYLDNQEEGIRGYHGKLDIRPAYQREFVYDDEKRNAVIDTIFKGFPLNVMYWCLKDDGTYEILDGQQRTISFCQFANNEFMITINGNLKSFYNLTDEEKEKFLEYECFIYICEGTSQEKLDWFRVINIAGVKLTNQELLNAIYSGTRLSDAKLKFSKKNCPAYNLANKYVLGNCNRQEYLETALKWISKNKIEEYMATHQNDPNANELWLYFLNVIEWVKNTFKKYRNEMKGVDWGYLFDTYKDKTYDAEKLEKRISELMLDDEVQNKKGIYRYIFTGEEKNLNLRTFSKSQKRTAYEIQQGICPRCKNEGKDKHYELEEMEADHITPWREGGKTVLENCQMLCLSHNRSKGFK